MLIPTGVSAENVDRFVKCFADAWAHVAEDQGTIESHYHQRGRGNVMLQPHVVGSSDGIAAAGCNKDPFLMRANPLVVFSLPGGDAWITLLICEELAHAFLIASRDPTHVPQITSEAENAACAVMERWGCDMQEHQRLLDWITSHSRNGSWDPLPWT